MALFNSLGNVSNKRKSGELGDSEDYPRKKTSWAGSSANHSGSSCWTVQWRNPQGKKHKTWEGDGVLVFNGDIFTLYDTESKFLGTGKYTVQRSLQDGDELVVGGKDVLIDCAMDISQLKAGTCFTKTPAVAPLPSEKDVGPSSKPKATHRPFVPLQPSNTYKSTVAGSLPQLQAVAKRQYPASAAGPHIDITEAFEDDGVPVGDRYKSQAGSKLDPSIESLWAVNWRKGSTKKNKTWDGDGMLHQKGSVVRFLSEDGKKVHGSTNVDTVLSIGSKVFIGSKEIQIESGLPLSQLNGESNGTVDLSYEKDAPPASTFSSTVRKFKAPAMSKQVEAQQAVQAKPKPAGPLHDPEAEGAIVMKTPSLSQQSRYNPKGRPLVPVILDPLLAKKLRPHQVEGVKFMYECVMGMGKHEGQGCILADAMGLGKTLQTIALIWTLLKQNPYGGSGNGPVMGKAMIVCPVSLVENWRKEFHKWIGRDRIGIFTGDCDKTAIKQFINSRIHQVLIIGYERLRGVITELAYCNPPIGLIVCDEGHRLKTAGSKTTKMFEALRTKRRVILSGTPIQNDLGEFHAMGDSCNPGLLDEYATFKKVFETPIIASRAPDCSSKVRDLGTARAEQLQLIYRSFVLRREATILSNYLPPKFEYVVFVSPSKLQLSMMAKLLSPEALNTLASSTAKSLALIQTLSKLCNSPHLLKNKADDTVIGAAVKLMPTNTAAEDVSLSGKLTALSNILQRLHKETDEKCIVVSHYTSTLDVVETFCTKRRYTYFRLDGQTPQGSRQDYVDKFNKSSQSERFLFLLSAKAGGVGLNLIGASRLVLIDGDWNPSHDLQAMARIHRDGQKRPVFIYRLLTAGTIDEKIYQRQITKLGLSEAMMGNNASSSKSKTDSFTSKELRDLFKVYPHVACHTHELLSCPCGTSAVPPLEEEEEEADKAPAKPRRKFIQDDSDEEDEEKGFMLATQVDPEKQSKSEARRKREALASLAEWTHINCMKSTASRIIQDDVLCGLVHSTNKPGPIQNLAGTGLDEIWNEFEDPIEEQQETSVKDVPGGTMTFVFERVSKTDL